MRLLIQLAIEFFKTGLFAVGGGLATVPFLKEMAAKYHWFSVEMLTTMIAISESTPGPIGVNMATYVGYHTVTEYCKGGSLFPSFTNIFGYQAVGVFGGIVTTLSLVCPSVIVICIIANMFQKFKDSVLVKDVFYGLRPAVIALIVSACISIFLVSLFNIDIYKATSNIKDLFKYKGIILLVLLLVLNKKFSKLHPIFFIIFAAAAGVIFKF